jgi:sugar/nucleoside kinase (ribokinase family)
VRVVCAGDCGVDRYVDLGLDRPGGITLNLAANAREAFAPTDEILVLTAVGTDAESRIVREALTRLRLTGDVVERTGATSVQYIAVDPSGEKRFLRYEAGVLADWRLDDRARALIATADLLVTPVYRQIHGLFESILAAPCRGLRAVDFLDLSDVDDPAAFVARVADRIDVGFIGLQASNVSLIDDLDRLSHQHGRLFVVTLGAEGSLALGGATRLACPAVPVPRVVDTTGAGDSYAAAFLAEYSRTRDVSRSLHRGAERAARIVQSVGAFPWE